MSGFPALERPVGGSLIVHASESWYDDVVSGRFDFFEKLAAKAQAEGRTTGLMRAKGAASVAALRQAGHVHVLIGPRQPVGPGVLHAHPGYLRGFWYLDPAGVNMDSSLLRAVFDPAAIDAKAARYFFDGVSGWNLRENVSKFPQAARGALPPAFAVVFLQEIEHFANPAHYIDTQKILKLVAREADGRRVYVKLHPAQGDATRAMVAQMLRKAGNLQLSAASIHDLAQASDLVVTQNSAAGFEALMQRKPVITCARCDYHHATVVAKRPAQLVQALHVAAQVQAGFAFEKYLYWFLAQQLLEPAKPEFADRVWARVMARVQCMAATDGGVVEPLQGKTWAAGQPVMTDGADDLKSEQQVARPGAGPGAIPDRRP